MRGDALSFGRHCSYRTRTILPDRRAIRQQNSLSAASPLGILSSLASIARASRTATPRSTNPAPCSLRKSRGSTRAKESSLAVSRSPFAFVALSTLSHVCPPAVVLRKIAPMVPCWHFTQRSCTSLVLCPGRRSIHLEVSVTAPPGSARGLPRPHGPTPAPWCSASACRAGPAGDGHQTGLGAASGEPAVGRGVAELVRVESGRSRGLGCPLARASCAGRRRRTACRGPRATGAGCRQPVVGAQAEVAVERSPA